MSIISGQQRGVLASLIRLFLSVLTYPYSGVLNIRNVLYKYGIVKSTRLPVNVISVGNITMGGTGKTPLVELLAKDLRSWHINVAILSRGYGSHNSFLVNKSEVDGDNNSKTRDLINDEYLVLRENLKEVPVLLGKDRVQNGEKAIKEYGVDCLILDDGFQHLKMKRDLDIVVIDSLNPLTNNSLIPGGTLREPLKNLSRADIFVLSHCNLCDGNTLKSIYAKLNEINADAPVCESIHKPVYLESIEGDSLLYPEWLKGKRVMGLCAIGNPESFKSSLIKLGAHLIGFRTFRDHHYYTQGELNEVIAESKSLGLDAIVVTQKDIVKIRNKNINGANFMSLKVEMRITKGMEFFEKTVSKIFESK